MLVAMQSPLSPLKKTPRGNTDPSFDNVIGNKNSKKLLGETLIPGNLKGSLQNMLVTKTTIPLIKAP
jgi:hypothetical protein